MRTSPSVPSSGEDVAWLQLGEILIARLKDATQAYIRNVPTGLYVRLDK